LKIFKAKLRSNTKLKQYKYVLKYTEIYTLQIHLHFLGQKLTTNQCKIENNFAEEIPYSNTTRKKLFREEGRVFPFWAKIEMK